MTDPIDGRAAGWWRSRSVLLFLSFNLIMGTVVAIVANGGSRCAARSPAWPDGFGCEYSRVVILGLTISILIWSDLIVAAIWLTKRIRRRRFTGRV